MSRLWHLCVFVIMAGFALAMTACTQTYSVEVSSAQKISDTQGNLNLNTNLNNGDQIGAALANLGDLNADGMSELAAGSPDDDTAGTDRGAVRVVFLDTAGQVQNSITLTQGLNGFTGTLQDNDHFGSAIAAIADLDGDNIPDMAVGAPGDDDNGSDRGALWIVFLNADGSVHYQQKISDLVGGLVAGLEDNDQFGDAVASADDINADGIPDLVVGSRGCDDGGTNRGAVYILFMNRDGTVQSQQKISATSGNFSGVLHDGDQFGSAVAGIGDLDGDGIPDIAVGASGDDSGGSNRGAVWVLFMNRDGTVRAQQPISQTDGQFDQVLSDGENFGSALADVGDLNDDGRDELAVGANHNGDGGLSRGAVYILFLKQTGEVISSSRISQNAGNFPDSLSDSEQFGDAVTGLGDLDGDGNKDIAVGANLDDDGGSDRGALWVLFMSSVKVGYRSDPNASLATYFAGTG